ncbi:electron transfer flavoprotein subunit alpha/FixB family protein [Cohnella hashimotonis]|uniref:Electron transfer flavoprotein subunit alpha/FixB family protein n=1 Tax=Cohnella hashimotonis TaxID=2826895 RepID=A0ABT6TJF6_9BACL|nr:electron transfer flavoprotein subunit alpha/FixB family protein [Cohnella hashimotonis]MDI4646696.1 electron transfer flavoprotein subunit alpha/FixB family protein [Cohnella hashimotonis]
MSKTYLIVTEQRDGKLRRVSLEALRAALDCAEAGDEIHAALLGEGLDGLAAELAGYPLAQVHAIEGEELRHYNPEAYIGALAPLLEALRPAGLFLGHTALGRDLAPALAARLSAGQISDVTAIERDGGERDGGERDGGERDDGERDDGERHGGQIVFVRPLYAGKAIERKVFTAFPQVVTVRANNLPAAEPRRDGGTAIVAKRAAAPVADLRTVVREVVRRTAGKIDLTEARIVIAGGRGVKSAEGFRPLEELAGLLGGAVGASRGACDAGYCDYGLQIGQTGKVVTPEIYIACGISGAIQHLAGMSGSRVIVAINKDPEAPIFSIADFGIVGDLFEVVPLLTQAFRQALA